MASGGGRPQESIAFDFTKVEYGFVGMNDKNAGVATPKRTYDIALGKVV